MARLFHCDICKKTCDRIVGKIFYTPLGKGSSKEGHYSHHADVGDCCELKLKEQINFRRRMTAKEYQDNRRRRAG